MIGPSEGAQSEIIRVHCTLQILEGDGHDGGIALVVAGIDASILIGIKGGDDQKENDLFHGLACEGVYNALGLINEGSDGFL